MTRYSKEERLRHIELWKESGLNRREYCVQSGIKYGTFKSWFERRNAHRNTFIPVEVSSPEPTSQLDTENITITYPSGMVVNCPCSISSKLLTQLLSIK